MAQQTIPVLKDKFSDGKTPSGLDFGDIFDSFDHKSTKLAQSRILGLPKDLADKASKTDLANVVSGLNPMGNALNLQDLATKPKRNNDAYFVLDQLDENGDPYIYRYDTGLGQWINTKQVVFKNVAKKTDLEQVKGFFILDGYYMSRTTGKPISDTLYAVTPFLPIDRGSDITVTGYSGTNAARLIFYDSKKAYIDYQYSTLNGQQTETISKEDIPQNAVYIRCTTYLNAPEEGAVLGTNATVGNTILQFEKVESNISKIEEDNIYNEEGYINKNTGSIVSGAEYSHTIFLALIAGENLVVSGYSGDSNNVALAAFYDEKFSFLGYYNAGVSASVSNLTIPSEFIPEGAYYVICTRQSILSGNVEGVKKNLPSLINTVVPDMVKVVIGVDEMSKITGYGHINKNTGLVDDQYGTQFQHSEYLRLLDPENLFVTGYSGINNTVAMVAFYTRDFTFIAAYNNLDHQGTYTKLYIPSESIPAGAYYIRVSKTPAQEIFVSGAEYQFYVNPSDIAEIAQKQVLDIVEETGVNIFDEPGFIAKATGEVDTSSPNYYRYSIFLRIVNREGLVVTGYSGVTNKVALVAFYDEKFNFLGYYNTETNGLVNKQAIPVESIPENAYYIRATKQTSQQIYIEGVDKLFNMRAARDYINTAVSLIDVMPKRGVRANATAGGHLKLTNYAGNEQNIHPKVLYFSESLWGYKYWMAYTPYPNGNTQYENPCIAVSADGYVWGDFPGAPNPLADTPPNGYNSDTHLIYREDTGTLECWYREYDATIYTFSIKRRTTQNGVDWSDVEIIFDYDTSVSDMVSPAVIFEDGKYKLWYVRQVQIYYSETVGDDITKWTPQTLCAIDWVTPNLRPWHLDVIHTDKGYEFAVQAYKRGLDNNSSDLWYVLEDSSGYSLPVLIIERGDLESDIDYQGIYRSSLLVVDNIYSIYYSGIAKSTFRALYLSKGRDVTRLRGVNL